MTPQTRFDLLYAANYLHTRDPALAARLRALVAAGEWVLPVDYRWLETRLVEMSLLTRADEMRTAIDELIREISGKDGHTLRYYRTLENGAEA